MDRYCTECNSTMTPSLVGYLCPECGHMQRFYSTATQQPLAKTGTDQLSAGSDDEPSDEPKITTTPNKKETAGQKKIHSTLKRLMVPELAPPHHEQIILDNQPQAVKPEKAEATLYQADNETTAAVSKPMPSDQPTRKPKTWLWIVLAIVTAAVVAATVLILLSPRSS